MTEQLSVNLPVDVAYVYGIVNGEEAQFELTAPGVWSAVVPKAEDFRYVISITAYTSGGSSTQYDVVLYYSDGLVPPKIDWTSDDYYNFEDLDRVEANTQFVARIIEDAGYPVPSITIELNRSLKSIERNDSMNRIEGNIKSLADSFYRPVGWLEPETDWARNKRFSYVDANRLEIDILLLHDFLLKTLGNIMYCGTFNCGGDDL